MLEKITEKDIFSNDFINTNLSTLSKEQLEKAFEVISAKADVLRFYINQRKFTDSKHS